MTLEAGRRGRLEEARFRSILRDSFGVDPTGDVAHYPFGVAAAHETGAWIVSSSDDPSVLGGVLAWLLRSDAPRLDLVVEHHAGMHARRAEVLAPEVTVWQLVEGRVEPAAPDPLGDPTPAPGGVEDLEAMIVRAGADVCRESGIVRAEVAGLEVGRVVEGPDGFELEPGVGRFDREAGALLHAEQPSDDALAAVVAQIAPHRRAGAAPHPVGRLARSRWLRAQLLDDPSPLGLDELVPVDPIPARGSLLDDVPASFLARDGERRVLGVCSVGVDLSLVPELADQWRRHTPDEVRIVLPRRDRLAALVELCQRVPVPVTFVDIDVPWSASVT